MLHRPEKGAKAHRIGAQQRLAVYAFGAEADAEAAERRPVCGIEGRELTPDFVGRQTTEPINELKHQAAPDPAQRQGADGEKRSQPALYLASEEFLQPPAHSLARF